MYQDTEFPLLVNETVEIENKINQWLRPGEIQDASTSEDCDWALFREPACNDVIQGKLPDCWFLTAAASIAEKKFLLERIFPVNQLNPYGVYGFKLCINGDWKEVIIDDKLPCDSDKQLKFAKAKRKQLWVPLLEKAIAKLLGGYSALNYKTLTDGMRYLTGCAVEVHFTHELNDEGHQQALWERLRMALQDGFIIACNTYPNSHTDLQKVKLRGRHGYTFLAIALIGDVKLFQLRNIWGKVAFSGNWSEGSDKWKDVPEHLVPLEGKGNTTEGIFWISMEDFSRYFASLIICVARENYYEHSAKAKLFQEGDTSWDAFEFEIFDTAQVDINLQPIDSQIVQFLLTADGKWATNDYKTLIGFASPASQEQADLTAANPVLQKPSLTFSNRVIHRLVQNSELA
ncbi:calpain-15-like [Watersipora subatra]|uniref:calpain-15-like n=1 Tax=Watersipora subatra TaxID=2589382 RepID=UPI00355BCF40